MALNGSPDNDGLCRLETLHAFVPFYASLMQSMHIDLSAGVHFTGEGQMEGLSCQRRVRIWLQIDNVALHAGFENFWRFWRVLQSFTLVQRNKNQSHKNWACVRFMCVFWIHIRNLTALLNSKSAPWTATAGKQRLVLNVP